MKIKISLMAMIFLTLGKISSAQNIAGVWKGESLCQDKNSSCHDEKVIYHIVKGTGNESYQIDAFRIADGKEIDMGILDFTYDPQRNILYLIDSARQVKWEFKIAAEEMHGTLISQGKLFRIINLKRAD